ncbi:chitinase-3-like protein 2 [Cherax quadricarinatus]|uniref:chitinase-3-like protein 2 n=1 Tax=Cherax quadricarinatus TaxID=27406 RepID=UPI00387E51D5
MASQFVRSNTRKIIILGLIWILVMIVLSYCGCDVYNSSLKHDDHESSSDHVLLPLKEYKNYLENENSTDKKILCYYSIPQNGSSETPLTAKDIDSTLCTHIIISKAKIENTTIVPVDEGDFKVYAEVVAMKKQNPDLYVLLSLATGFSSLVQDRIAVASDDQPECRYSLCTRQVLRNPQVSFVTTNSEPPQIRHELASATEFDPPRDDTHSAYVNLTLAELGLNLASHPPLLLTVAVGASQSIIDNSYEIDQLAKCVDFVSVMGYNYHMYKPYLPFTGHNSPLSNSSNEKGFFSTMNIHWDTIYLIMKGVPKEKLIIGIPTFGHTWREISFSTLVQWVLDAGVAGVMTWNLNSDDWAGLCNGQKFELHAVIKNMLMQKLLES